MIEWCEELLAGRAGDDDPAWPDIAWLGGTVGWVPYWARTWGARGLLQQPSKASTPMPKSPE